jgi:hypothetical protein
MMLANVIGILGSILCVINYFLLVKGTFKSTDSSYLWMNIVASGLVLISLMFYINIASIILQIFFIGIGIYGLTKANDLGDVPTQGIAPLSTSSD